MTAPSLRPGMGAIPFSGGCLFRVWAPHARAVEVALAHLGWVGQPLALEPGSGGYWSGEVSGAAPGEAYKFIIDSPAAARPLWRVDAYARQVTGNAESADGIIVDHAAWTAGGAQPAWAPFTPPAFNDYLIYQLHLGSYVGRGDGVAIGPDETARFQDLAVKFGYIRALGFNAIALLPIGEYWGDLGGRLGTGLGYAPTDLFAPDAVYGTPDDLRRMIDAAHRAGLAVILDVVYNHAATENNRYWEYDGAYRDGGIYMEDGGDSGFGHQFALWKQELRPFLLDNARMWLRDYRVDALRFDAVHYMPPDAVRALVWQLRSEFPDRLLIAEYANLAPDPLHDLGFHAIWAMPDAWRFHDAVSGGERMALLDQLITGWRLDHAWNLVRYLLGSHDDVKWDSSDPLYAGDTAHRFPVERLGGRTDWTARAKARLGWALTVVLPGTPLLFAGCEGHTWGYWWPEHDQWGDHRFDWWLIGDELGLPMQRLVRDANHLRWSHPALRSDTLAVLQRDATNGVYALKRWNQDGDVILVLLNCGPGQWPAGGYAVDLHGEGGRWEECFNSQAPLYGGFADSGNSGISTCDADGWLRLALPPWAVLVFVKR